MAVVGGLDTDRRYGTKEPQRWRRRRHIAHIYIVGGVGGGRRAASSIWRSAHDGKRSPKMRDLTVHRRQQWPTESASVAAASPQKFTTDRIYIVLDIWKVREATERFGTSWVGRGGRNEVERRDVFRTHRVSRRVFVPNLPQERIALFTSITTRCVFGKKRVLILVDTEELKVA